MAENGIPDAVLQRISEDAVGFTCAEVARTALGFAGDRVWLKFEDPAMSGAAEDTALALTKTCLMGRKGVGVGILTTELRKLQ